MKYKQLQPILNDESKIKIVSGGRYSGKTTLLFLSAIKSATEDKNEYNYIFMPDYTYIRYMIPEFIKHLDEQSIEYDYIKRHYMFNLSNGSHIIFRSYYNPESIKRIRTDWIGIEEAIWCKPNFIHNIIPTLNAKGKLLICSTPTNKDTEFLQMFLKGLNSTDNKYIKSFIIKTSDNPILKAIEYDKEAKSLFTQSKYQQECNGIVSMMNQSNTI